MKIPKIISENLAEETGWHIGDGSMNFYNNRGKKKGFYQLRGHIEDDLHHYVNIIKPIFKKLYDIDVNIRVMPSTRVIGFQIWNNDLVNFKRSLDLSFGKKLDINIPSFFLSNKNLTKAVLRGIFDTDGGIYLEKKNNKLYPRIYITTISFNLSEQLLHSFRKLGFRITRYSQLYNQDFKRQRSYILSIRGVEMFEKFMEEISPKNLKHIEKYRKFKKSQNL